MNLLPFEISFSAVFREIAAYIVSVCMALFSFAAPPAQSFAPLDAANLQMQFSAVTDTHIEFNPAEQGVARFRALREGLLDMSRAAAPNDAVVMAGDNTENGQIQEYLLLYNYLRCFGGMSDEIMDACAGCPFMKCCKEKGLQACSECAGYPCDILKDYAEKYVNRYNQI